MSELEEKGLISRQEKLQLMVSNPRMPRISGLPKIHKEGNQIRPVVTNVDAPASKIAKLVVKKLRGFEIEGSRSVKNSLELIKHLEKLKIEENEELVSFDVKALFPSIPGEEAVRALKNHIMGLQISDEEVEKLCGLVDIVVSQKCFEFDNKVFSQESGVSIGCPLSPLLAELFMNDLESKFWKEEWAPREYFRYVDDILAVIPKGKSEEITRAMSGIHENIDFTCEREKDGQIAFLDLMIIRTENGIKYEIYRKPTDTQLCIPADSFHPEQYKLAAFESLFHRLYNVPLEKEAFEKEKKYIL